MDTDPPPSLPGDNVRGVAKDRVSCPQHRVPILKEVLKSGGGRGYAHESGPVHAPDSVDPDIADAPPMEGMVDGRHTVSHVLRGKGEGSSVRQFEGALIHGGLRLGGCPLL